MVEMASGDPAAVSRELDAAAHARRRRHRVLPGFGLAMGWTLFYLSLIVLLPLAALALKSGTLGWDAFWATVGDPRVVAAYRLSFGVALAAAAINVVAGTVIAWVLVRYEFPGRRLVDAMVDLPFALPTAVAGIALTALYAPNGWLGGPLAELGLKVAFTPLGVGLALVFVGLPFVVRTVQPVLADLDREIEEAAATLGATRPQTLRRVLLPLLLPAIVTGFILALSRAIGEYGSVIFIAGNMPFVSEIAPLLIVVRLEQYQYAEAAAIAVGMLSIAFVLIVVINLLQRWQAARG
jgi:sulfate transport system permease protein